MSKATASKASRAANSRLANFMKKPRTSQDLHSTTAWKGDQTYTLMQHTPQFSLADLVLSKDLFPEAQEGDVLELIPEDHSTSFVLQVTSASLATGKNLTISVNKQVCTAFNLPGRDFLIRVQKLTSQSYEIEAIVFSIKDQFISRRDMAKIEKFSLGKAFFKTQKVTMLGAKLQITDILVGGKPAMSGVVTKKTLVTFRSKSCRIIWLIEVTKEMWTFTEEGLLLFDKVLAFIRCALERSSLTGATHNISVAAFARLFFPTVTNEEAALHQLSCSAEGAYYVDICKEICDVTDLRTSWKSAFPTIKRELFTFMRSLNWSVDVPSIMLKAMRSISSQEAVKLPSRLSTSQETCILEVINMALNRFEYHAQDRKLINTGQCILVISAGVGAYYAKHSFVKLTKERVTNCAVNLDIVSVNYRPLHLTPVFIYTLEKLRETRDRAREAQDKETYEMYLCYSDTQPSAEKSASHPTWLRLHFFYSFAQLEGTSNIQSALHTLTLARAVTQPTPLVSFSCFEESVQATLNYVNSKLSYSLKDTLLPFTGRAVPNLQTEIGSPLLGAQPQSFDQATIKTHLKAFCRAFDNRVFSYRRGEETPKDTEKHKTDLSRLSEVMERRGFRGTIIGGMQPVTSYDQQAEAGTKRKYSEDSSDTSKDSIPRSDSPRRNSIHDWTSSKARNSVMNPFAGGKHEKKRHSRFNRRWARLFPGTIPFPPDTVDKDEYCETSLNFYENVWRLLLEPALLPLTSDFWPGNEELGNSNPWQSSVSPTSNLLRDTLVNELVYLRLQKEFQLVTNPIDRFGRKIALNPNDMYLSRGSCNHVIMPSLQDEYNVDIRFYTSRDPPPDAHISAIVYNSLSRTFVVKEFVFTCGLTDWGRLDSIILGHVPKTELPMTDTTKLIKMVLLPRNFRGVDFTTEAEEAHQMEDFVTFHRLLQEALSREQQKASGDERERVEIEVLPMRNPQESLGSTSFVLKFEDPEEWITIEHDGIFKPNFAFSITLTWICSLGPAVAERVNLMKRKAEQAGLPLVQVPLWDGYQMKNPYRPRIIIKLPEPSWMRHCLQSSFLEMLEMSHDFLIHKSGAFIIKICDNDLFFQENYMMQCEEKITYYEKIVDAALVQEVIKEALLKAEKAVGLP